MRSLSFLAAIVAVMACSDNQQSTSPGNVADRAPSAGQSSQVVQVNGKPAPGAVAFTKATNFYSQSVTIPGGSAKTAIVQCPAGSVPSGGGYELSASGGTWPMVYLNSPNASGWVTGADNTQAGAATVYIQAWVICLS